MKKIYFETTIFNYYFDQERGDLHRSAIAIFEAVGRGDFEGFTSTNVVLELQNAEEPKQTNMLNLINKYNIKILNVTFEVNHLSSLYISAGIIPIKYQYDASHIACAAVYKLDYILSFNFKHINKPKTKTMTDLINTHEGYEKVLICIPMELLDNDE